MRQLPETQALLKAAVKALAGLLPPQLAVTQRTPDSG